MKSVTVLLVVSLVAVAAAAPASKKNYYQPFSFAFITDVPYEDEQIVKLDVVIREINNHRGLRWVLHGGNIKGGSDPCTDEVILFRFRQYQNFDFPFIYTPGDNEWTDCHLETAGKRRLLERLQFVRKTFFPKPGFSTGGSWKKLYTQANVDGFEKFVENFVWYESGVIFSTIHVVGSNNDLKPWSGVGEELPEGVVPTTLEECPSNSTWCPVRITEFLERNAASLEWLKTTFAAAEENDAAGVFIAIHANPNDFQISEETGASEGFNEFIKLLTDLTVQFDKPVIVAHGDSQYYRIDHPIVTANAAGESRRLVRFTRLEGFGTSDVYWVKIVVDANSDEVFEIVPMLTEKNYPF